MKPRRAADSRLIPVVVIHCPEELREGALEALQEALNLAVSGRRSVVLNLTATRLVDGAALRCVLRAGMELEQRDRRLALASPTRPVLDFMLRVGLERVLAILPTVYGAKELARRPSTSKDPAADPPPRRSVGGDGTGDTATR